MPQDIQSVIKDPKFLALGPDDQVAVLKHLHEQRPSEAEQAKTAPGISAARYPEGLRADPEQERVYMQSGVAGVPLPMDVPKGYGGKMQDVQTKAINTGIAAGSAIEAPVATATSLAGGYATGKVARVGARAAGASEHGQDIAEKGGELAGGVGGAMLGHYLPARELAEWTWALTSPRKFMGKVADTFLESLDKRVGATAEATGAARAGARIPKPPTPEASRIVSPESATPPVPVTYQSYPRAQLYEMAKKGDIQAGLELVRSPGDFKLPPNFKYLIEESAKRIPWRASGPVTLE